MYEKWYTFSMLEDLEDVLSTFCKAERRLYEARRQKKEIFAINVDTYDAKDHPIVRHTFYGRTEDEAEAYFNHHIVEDRMFRAALKGSYEGMKIKNTRPFMKKVQPAQVKADGLPKPGGLPKDAIKGQLQKKLGV